jgi:hypothetical protein
MAKRGKKGPGLNLKTDLKLGGKKGKGKKY